MQQVYGYKIKEQIMLFNFFYLNLKHSFNNGFSSFINIVFFLLIILLFPFCIGPDMKVLNKLSNSLIWITIILIILLSFKSFLKNELDSGFLEQYIFLPCSLELIFFIKILIHWLFNIAPIFTTLPLIFLFLNIKSINLLQMVYILSVTSLILVFMGSFISLLTLTLKHEYNIISLLLIPLYLPVIIFSINYIETLNDSFFVYLHPQNLILIGLLFTVFSMVPLLMKKLVFLIIN